MNIQLQCGCNGAAKYFFNIEEILMCEALPPTLMGQEFMASLLHGSMTSAMHCFFGCSDALLASWSHGFMDSWLYDSSCNGFLMILGVWGRFFEASCLLGSPVAPVGSQNGSILTPSGSDLAPMGSQSGSMGTPRGHYGGHLAPQVVPWRHQMGHMWHHGGAMVARWGQDMYSEGQKQ